VSPSFILVSVGSAAALPLPAPASPPYMRSCSSALAILYRLQLRLVHPLQATALPRPSPAGCNSTSSIPTTPPRSPLAALPHHPRAPPPPLAGRPRAPSTSSSTEPSERGMNVWRQTWCCTVALRCYIVISNCPSICYIVAMF
jgi:hypothetical protein